MDYTLIGFILYLVAVFIIGLITFKKSKSQKDYYIGGRKLNPWVVAFSERASGESAWLLLGLPGAAYASGYLELWTVFGCLLGIIFSWIVIAKDLRVDTEKYKAITLPNYFAEKFGKEDNLIRIISTIIIIFFFTFYLAAQFNGAGKVLNVTFGIPHITGILIGAIIIIFYTMLGGYFAVVWTDLIQGIIMIGALVIIPLASFIEIESGKQAVSLISNTEAVSGILGSKTGWAAIAAILGGLSWGLGYLGQPHLVTRYMSIKNPEKIKVARRIAYIWAIPAFFGAFFIGIAGYHYYGSGFFTDIEKIMPTLAKEVLPAWLSGIFISGAIAAMMSTADSQLLVISSSIMEDFYKHSLKSMKPEKELLKLSRIITLLIGLFGFIIAITSEELIFSMVSYAWSGLGASFGPALLLSLKWKGTTKEGIIAGLLTGSITTIIWQNLEILNQAISVRLVSWVLALIAIIIFSKLSKREKLPS